MTTTELLPEVNLRVLSFMRDNVTLWTGAEDALIYERTSFDIGVDISEVAHTVVFIADPGVALKEGDRIVYQTVDEHTAELGPQITRKLREPIYYKPIGLLRVEVWDS